MFISSRFRQLHISKIFQKILIWNHHPGIVFYLFSNDSLYRNIILSIGIVCPADHISDIGYLTLFYSIYLSRNNRYFHFTLQIHNCHLTILLSVTSLWKFRIFLLGIISTIRFIINMGSPGFLLTHNFPQEVEKLLEVSSLVPRPPAKIIPFISRLFFLVVFLYIQITNF